MKDGYTKFIRKSDFHKAMHLIKQSIWCRWQLIQALWCNICLYVCGKTSFFTSSSYNKVHLQQKLSAPSAQQKPMIGIFASLSVQNRFPLSFLTSF